MAYTQPDNIYSADTDTVMDLPAITGAMAASIQAALEKRGNSFAGESQDRDSAPPGIQDGTIWVDTNGDKKVHVRQGGAWVPLVPETHFYAARIYLPSAQNISPDTTTTLTWNGADTQLKGFTSNNTGLSCPRTGWYQLSGGVRWDANTDGVRQLRLTVGGTNVASTYVNAAHLAAHTVSIAMRVTSGQHISLDVWHNAESTISTRTGLGLPYLSAVYLGE